MVFCWLACVESGAEEGNVVGTAVAVTGILVGVLEVDEVQFVSSAPAKSRRIEYRNFLFIAFSICSKGIEDTAFKEVT